MAALEARAQHADDEEPLAGRVALVTGGTRGIGGAGASVHQGNVGAPEGCRRVVGEVIERGQLDDALAKAPDPRGRLIDRGIIAH